jgi:hypothetical protein
MMHPLWRLKHDWIHRNKAGQLDFLKKSVVYCKKIHIRSKSVSEISLHAIKSFFETSIEPKKLEQMRTTKPDVRLLRASLEGIKSNVLGILNKHNEIMLKSSEILFQQQQLEKAVRRKRESDGEKKFFSPLRSTSRYRFVCLSNFRFR